MKTQAAVFWNIVSRSTYMLIYNDSAYTLERRRRFSYLWRYSRTIKYRIKVSWQERTRS